MDEQLREAEKAYALKGSPDSYVRQLARSGIDFLVYWVYDRGNWSKLIVKEGNKLYQPKHVFPHAILACADFQRLAHLGQSIEIYKHKNASNYKNPPDYYAAAIMDFGGAEIVLISDFPSLVQFGKEVSLPNCAKSLGDSFQAIEQIIGGPWAEGEMVSGATSGVIAMGVEGNSPFGQVIPPLDEDIGLTD